jgi:hypothetical protein
VFGLGPATRIYLAAGVTDMRKGFEGLYGLGVAEKEQVLSRVRSSRPSLRWQKMTLFCHCCHRLAGISIVP